MHDFCFVFKGTEVKLQDADTDYFLSALRRLSPPPPANSPTAETAVGSDTLTEAGYARSTDENYPTVCVACFSPSPPSGNFTSVPIYTTKKLNTSLNFFKYLYLIYIHIKNYIHRLPNIYCILMANLPLCK